MKYVFLFFFSFLLACNNSSDNSNKSLTNEERNNLDLIPYKTHNAEIYLKMKTTTFKNRIYYGKDSLRISYKDVDLGKYKLAKNKHHFIVKSEEEVKDVFLSCDSINNIDFDKYILIGIHRNQNGFEKISPVVLSIKKEKEILVYFNFYLFSTVKVIAGRITKWILIDKPKVNWKMKVLFNTTFPLDN
ncbi:MAG: hypothetical protein HXX09_07735 [Bacteroidetes bacterium]|nr:hypothetical protein [Bacteroidota bacterium]